MEPDVGYFTKPDGSAPSDLAPLTTSRVTASLDSHNWHYDITESGDVGGWWDGYWFLFSFRGQDKEIFFVHAVWNKIAPPELYSQLAVDANEWNVDHLWPMVSVRQRDDDALVMADLSVDYSCGLTDEQLDLHIRCAIDTMVSALGWFTQKYPDLPERG